VVAHINNWFLSKKVEFTPKAKRLIREASRIALEFLCTGDVDPQIEDTICKKAAVKWRWNRLFPG